MPSNIAICDWLIISQILTLNRRELFSRLSEQLKEFQVNGYTEHEIEAFLDATEAQYRCIEDWSGAYVKPGMDVIGWGDDWPI